MLGWKAYFRLAETPRVWQELDQWIRHRMRAIQLKQWKRGRTIYSGTAGPGGIPEVAAQVAGNPPLVAQQRDAPERRPDLAGPTAGHTPSLLTSTLEPPDADPHVRWCGRGGG